MNTLQTGSSSLAQG